MYCTKCGKENKSDALFCVWCGKPIAQANLESDSGTSLAAGAEANNAAQPPASGCAGAHPTQNETDAPLAPKREIMRYVAVAAVAVLIVGVGYAGYRAFIGAATPQADTQPALVESKSGGMVAESEAAPKEVSGEPESALQVGRIMGIAPKEIPSYLESKGLVANSYEWGEGMLPVTSWEVPSSDTDSFYKEELPEVTQDSAGNEGSSSSSAGTSSTTGSSSAYSITFGLDLTDFYHAPSGGIAYVEADLQQGKAPNSAVISGLKMDFADDESVNALVKKCDLGSVSAKYEYTKTDEFNAQFAAYVGFLKREDTDYVWVLHQRSDSSSGVTTSLCIMTKELAEEFLESEALYSSDEYSSADAPTQALMLAQSFISGETYGNGGMRTNILTGESEISESYRDPETSQWVSKWVSYTAGTQGTAGSKSYSSSSASSAA